MASGQQGFDSILFPWPLAVLHCPVGNKAILATNILSVATHKTRKQVGVKVANADYKVHRGSVA